MGLNIHEYYESCGLDAEQIAKAEAVTQALMGDGNTNVNGAGQVLMAVTAFVVEVIRNGIATQTSRP